MLLFDAIYINTGGGKVLLELLMQTIFDKGKSSVVFLIDKRLESLVISRFDDTHIIFLEPNEKSRKRYYEKLPPTFKSIFCFANVPPPIKITSIPVYIYFHCPILTKLSVKNLSILTSVNYLLKRYYIRYKTSRLYTWVVQTNSMKKLLFQKLKIKEEKIIIIPFYAIDRIKDGGKRELRNNNKFLYVTDGLPHKNNINLLKAWKLINATNENLELHITIAGHFYKLISYIKKLKKNGIKIVNHGYCDKHQLNDLYKNCNYLIFPSIAESFGLPLLEAALAGCEILASDLPYVYDVVMPLIVFDPLKPSDIKKTVLQLVDNPHWKGTKAVIPNELDKLIKLIM